MIGIQGKSEIMTVFSTKKNTLLTRLICEIRRSYVVFFLYSVLKIFKVLWLIHGKDPTCPRNISSIHIQYYKDVKMWFLLVYEF